MKKYPKRSKPLRSSGHHYFTPYGTAPLSLSLATINEKELSEKDVEHYHKTGYEFYLTLKGEAILNIEGEKVILNKDNVIMVEPKEKHFVEKVLKAPFSVIVVNSVNKEEDKVLV